MHSTRKANLSANMNENSQHPMKNIRRPRVYSYDEDGGRSFALEGDQDSDLDIYGSWRTRRALPREYFIEIMVVADAKMIDYHGDSLASYILVLMNTVYMRLYSTSLVDKRKQQQIKDEEELL
jgi:hypothetical protein